MPVASLQYSKRDLRSSEPATASSTTPTSQRACFDTFRLRSRTSRRRSRTRECSSLPRSSPTLLRSETLNPCRLVPRLRSRTSRRRSRTRECSSLPRSSPTLLRSEMPCRHGRCRHLLIKRTKHHRRVRDLFMKVDVRLPGKGNSNSHGARPVHPTITMIKWIWAVGIAAAGICESTHLAFQFCFTNAVSNFSLWRARGRGVRCHHRSASRDARYHNCARSHLGHGQRRCLLLLLLDSRYRSLKVLEP